ncbi:hypothetical protein C6990_04660 [Nitrosopumilus sp. b3]|nr:hypothetical protein C6990_04660 [Nitrosopumilus sp. b3]
MTKRVIGKIFNKYPHTNESESDIDSRNFNSVKESFTNFLNQVNNFQSIHKINTHKSNRILFEKIVVRVE